MFFRKFLSVLLLLSAFLTCSAAQTDVYSRDLFSRKSGYKSALRWSSVAPMVKPMKVFSSDSRGNGWTSPAMPTANGRFNASQLYAVGERNMPVLATTTADAVLNMATPPVMAMAPGKNGPGTPGDTLDPSTQQPLDNALYALLILAMAYLVFDKRKEIFKKGAKNQE